MYNPIPNIPKAAPHFSTIAHMLYTVCAQEGVDNRNACSAISDMLRWWGRKRKGCATVEILSDEMLLESYYTAVQLKLDPAFIRLLAAEMQRRNLKPDLRIGA